MGKKIAGHATPSSDILQDTRHLLAGMEIVASLFCVKCHKLKILNPKMAAWCEIDSVDSFVVWFRFHAENQ